MRFQLVLTLILSFMGLACASPEFTSEPEPAVIPTQTQQALRSVESTISTPEATPTDDPYPVETPTPAPTVVTLSSDGYPIPIPETMDVTPDTQLQLCNFQITTQTIIESDIGLTLSSPQAAITNAYGYAVIDWIPDSSKVLIHERVSGLDHSIVALDTSNNATDVLASNIKLPDVGSEWTNNSVIYIDLIDGKWTLQTVDDATRSIQTLYADVHSVHFDAQDTTVTFLADASITQMSLPQREIITTMFDFLPVSSSSSVQASYAFEWSPTASNLLIYGYQDLYLANSDSDTACFVDLTTQAIPSMQRVLNASWSSDGTKIAFIMTQHPLDALAQSTQLLILDVQTNQMKALDGIGSTVIDLAWSPDNQFLAFLNESSTNEFGVPQYTLTILDVDTGEVEMLSETAPAGIWQHSLAWSEDGAKIILNCPTEMEGRLCVVDVNYP